MLTPYQLEKATEWLADELPHAAVHKLLGGDRGLEQVPEPADRRAALLDALRLKGGSDGSYLGRARRALEKLREYAASKGMTDGGLPASAVFVNRLLTWVDAAAVAANRGSQGGTTVRDSVRGGLLILANHFGLDIDVTSIVAEAAAPPGKKRRRERRSGSLPIKFYCHFEAIAAAAQDSPQRFFARSFLVAMLFASLRLVDTLRACVMSDSTDAVIAILAKFSKDGAPLDVYLYPEGFLGPWLWWPAHRRALVGRPYVLPEFKAERKHAGDAFFLTAWEAPGRVASKPHAVTTFKALAAAPPLLMGPEQLSALGIAGERLTLIQPPCRRGQDNGY